MTYRDRPSISPVVAALFAARVLKRADRVLDLGCGTGIDSLTLAAWGVKRVAGLDADATVLGRAEQRRQRMERELGIELDNIEWHEGSVSRPHDCFPSRHFTVAIDGLLWTNLESASKPSYARQVARLLVPGGKLIIQARLDARFRFYDAAPAETFVPPSFFEHFIFGPLVSTHIPEHPRARGRHGKAGVALVIGRRRR